MVGAALVGAALVGAALVGVVVGVFACAGLTRYEHVSSRLHRKGQRFDNFFIYTSSISCWDR